ncbi:hypothetical protein [Polaromonas sp.]|uniref:hypothetical protein n=1 Tax=Polaromonas sp. TaxID=1869339 RepID=UPI003567403B
MAKTGRPPAISQGEHGALRDVVGSHPQATLAELAIAWGEHMSRTAPSTVTIRIALRVAGLQRMRPPTQPLRAKGQQPGTRYGYDDRHWPTRQPAAPLQER